MPNRAIVFIALGVILIVITILTVVISCSARLDAKEIAIAYNTISKVLSRELRSAGLHFGTPGFHLIIFPSVFSSIQFNDISCLNRDGVSIDIDVTLQFQVDPKYLYEIVMQFQDFDGFKQVLTPLGESSVHDACAHFNTTAFQSMRGYFQEKLLEEMREAMTPFHAILRDVQVTRVRRPADFETAVKDKEAAKENIKIAENERPKFLTQARTEYQKALKHAQIIKERADTDSNIILEQAEAEAKAVEARYSTETDTYAVLKTKMQFNVESLLTYMATRVLGASKNDIHINLKSPAQVNYEL